MVLGAVGGICEVALAGRIKKSNDEADAKLEANGSRDIEDRYSWQAEGATADLGDDSTLAGSQSALAQDAQDIDERGDWDGGSETAQRTADGTDEEHMQWINEGLPVPSPSRFVIDDVDSPGYGGAHDNRLSYMYETYPGHLTPRPATPGEAGYQHQEAEEQYYTGEGDETLGGSDSQLMGETRAPSPVYLGDPGVYSPVLMPQSADYLPQYRQSQRYIQHEDGSYTATRVSYTSARVVSYFPPARTPQ